MTEADQAGAAESLPLPEQGTLGEYAAFVDAVLDSHLESRRDPAESLIGLTQSFLERNAINLPKDTIAQLTDKRSELVRQREKKAEAAQAMTQRFR